MRSSPVAGPIVGRDEQLARLDAFAAAPSSVLLLRGPAGIGKTTLWREGVRRLRAGGRRVLTAQPTGAEAQLSFGALGDLLTDAVSDVRDALPDAQRRGLEVALSLRDPGGVAVDATVVARATLNAVRVLAGRGPLAVAIEDVQWLDASSAVTLEFVLRRIEQEAIQVLVSERTSVPRGTLPLGLDRMHERPEVVELGPLSLGALSHVLRARLDGWFPRPVLRKIHEAARGNPLLALELAHVLATRAEPVEPGRPLPVPAVYEELVRERVAALPAVTREALLEVAAVSEATPEIVDVDALEPAFAAELLEREGRRIRFRHPLMGAAVYTQAPRQQVAAAHSRLAARARSREERARHLALAADGPDPDVAAELEASANELARGAPASAAELLEQAIALTPPADDEARIRRSVGAADAHNRAGNPERAAELARGVDAPESLVFLADTVRTVALADRAVAAAHGNPLLEARALNARAETKLRSGDLRSAVADAGGAVAAARAAGDREVLVRALSHHGYTRVLRGDRSGIDVLQEARRLDDPSSAETRYFGPAAAIAGVLTSWDRLDEARPLYRQQLEVAERTGDEWVRPALLFHLVKVEVRAGNWSRARELADESYALKEAGGWEQLAPQLWARGLVAAHLGELEGARADAEQSLRLAKEYDDRLFGLYNRCLLGFVALSAGDAAAAAALLEEVPTAMQEIGIAEPGVFAASGDELEALVQAGKTAQARARIEQVEQGGRELDRPRELAAAARARALLEASVPEALRALEHCSDLQVPFERARTLLVLGTVHRRAKQWGAARERLTESLSELERLGAGAWAAKARAELARVGGRAASRNGLTETERRVAVLAAQGKSNKEVAAELFLSVRGVEANLSRVYAKLGIKRRAELAQRLA